MKKFCSLLEPYSSESPIQYYVEDFSGSSEEKAVLVAKLYSLGLLSWLARFFLSHETGIEVGLLRGLAPAPGNGCRSSPLRGRGRDYSSPLDIYSNCCAKEPVNPLEIREKAS